MKNIILFFLILFASIISFGQKTQFKSFDCEQILRAGDIKNSLIVGAVKKITLKCSPKGHGNFQEVSSGKNKDRYYFKKEHNVVWILFAIKRTGNLVLTIEPLSKSDDYDFLLFKNEGKKTAKQITLKKIKPVRSNLSRNKESNKGITGLSFTAQSTHSISGPNHEFSKPILVTKGDEYYIVIDNVYQYGKGCLIYLDYYSTKKITGMVQSLDSNKILNAEIAWEDPKTGKILAQTTSDPETGYYEMEVPYTIDNLNKKYVLSTYSENHFFSEKTYYSKDFIKDKLSPIQINIILPKLKKGLRNRLDNINFYGNSTRLIEGADVSLMRLKRLMKANKSLRILIEGHTNGCSNGIHHSQKLSENRALAIKGFLIKRKILEDRMKIIGYNCSKMLYPSAIFKGNKEQQELNRRVEILVIDY
ncbi:MAG: hypothetical protein COA97_08140 [Flavobacteriales bacterium]|nr:MAG: hypothetical protein COA97_08140 [Flavobacteriales bacterium]